MATITCNRKKFEDVLRYMTIDGSIPYVGMNITSDGEIKSVQYDKHTLGAMIVVVGEFDHFDIEGDAEFCLDAKKALDYLKALSKDETIKIEITEPYIIFRGSRKKITMDRLDPANVEGYQQKPPMEMTNDFLPLFKSGSVPTSMMCSIETDVLSEMVSDTSAVDQKQFVMHFEAPNTFKYEAKGDSSKRANDSIEAFITDTEVTGDTIDITVGIVIPQIAKLFSGAIEIHGAMMDDGPSPLWFKQISDGVKVGYLVPPIADVSEG